MINQKNGFVNQKTGILRYAQKQGGIFVFYDRFYGLCQKAGVTPTQVSRDLGIRQSTVSMWKNQGTTPKYQTLQKLSDYFGVSVDSLLGDLTDYVPDMGLPKLSSGAVQLAKDYDKLDAWGRKHVRSAANIELERMATPAPQEGQSTTPPPDAPETPPEGK